MDGRYRLFDVRKDLASLENAASQGYDWVILYSPVLADDEEEVAADSIRHQIDNLSMLARREDLAITLILRELDRQRLLSTYRPSDFAVTARVVLTQDPIEDGGAVVHRVGAPKR